MRLLRKLTHIGTRGVIDLRTDAERLEDYERRLAKERNDPGPRLHRTGRAQHEPG